MNGNENKKEIKRSIRRTLGLIAGLTKIPSTGKDRRGFGAEEKAFRAAEYWRKKKIIKNVRATKGFSHEDIEMKDFALTLLDDREVFVQVKNHYPYFSVMKKCEERGIFIFLIWENEDGETAKERMLDIIMRAYLKDLEPFQLRKLIYKIHAIKCGGCLEKEVGFVRRIFGIKKAIRELMFQGKA